MTSIEEYERGTTARFEVEFTDEDNEPIEPDFDNGNRDVTIEIKDATGGTVIPTTQMEEVTDTRFRFDWNTTEDLDLGEYEVEVRGVFQGDTALNRDRVRLVRTKEF